MGSTGYWEIRTYECGALGEKTKYWVPGEPPARGRKLGRSSERKQRQNEKGGRDLLPVPRPPCPAGKRRCRLAGLYGRDVCHATWRGGVAPPRTLPIAPPRR